MKDLIFHKLTLLFYYFFSKKIYHNKCRICKSEDIEKLNLFFFTFIKIYICNDCKICFQNPILKKSEISKFYSRFYRQKKSLKKQIELHDRGLRRGQYIFNFIDDNSKKQLSNLRILEIGSGYGGILSFFKKMNNQVESVEIDDQCNNFLTTKLNLLNHRTLDKIILQKLTFDIIILSHVIEHINDINGFFLNIKKIMHDSTILYIEVPTFHKNYKLNKRSIQIGHIWYFTEDNINLLLNKNNFKINKKNNKIQLICQKIV